MTGRRASRRGSTSDDMHDAEPRARSLAALIALAVCVALAFVAFAALGTWQLYRLQWKLVLIERVEQRVHAAPVPAPGSAQWPHISAEGDEYRHVRVTGVFLHHRTTLVQASTELGAGYWMLTPMRGIDGSVVLINRGFIAGARNASEIEPDDETISTVTGLLRMTEPDGGFLRRNDPAGERWYSRDVQAIAAARGLSAVAPYFVDADATPHPANTPSASASPVGGLTVVSFHNNHIAYALTWYALALMVACAGLWLVREEKRAALRTDTRPGSNDRDKRHGEHGEHGEQVRHVERYGNP
jgi:surfeit locus 1 family protein